MNKTVLRYATVTAFFLCGVTLCETTDMCDCWGTSTGVCYVGRLNLPEQTEGSEKITLYYDGSLVQVEDGTYCFKDEIDVGELNFLFINPELISCINEGNTIEALVVPEGASYHLYVLKRVECIGALQRTFNWRIQKAQLATHKKKGTEKMLVIPLHTLIIPLEQQFFKVDNHGAIVFTRQPFTEKNNTVNLPTPAANGAADKEALAQALARAQLALINLKNFHAPQPTKKINMDGHSVSMYYPAIY